MKNGINETSELLINSTAMDVDIKPVEKDVLDITDNICAVCYAEFLDIEDLNVHMTQHTQCSSNNYCTTCNYAFPDLEYYSLHILEEHLSSAVACEYCKKVFYHGKLHKLHEIKHGATKLSSRLNCSQCEAYFHNRKDLEMHEIEHGDTDEGVNLNQCFSMLSSLLNMNIWKFFEVRNENSTYCCCYCKLNTSDVTFYIKHLLDENVKTFTCENCYDVFPNKNRLGKHIKKYMLTCETYVRKNYYEKNCKKCNQTFPVSTLKRHLKECNGMNCNICKINFESIEKYSAHLKFHAKALQLSTCEFCHRQFVGKAALEKHFDRAHKDTLHLYKYKCQDCEQLFMHPKLLFAHYFTKHKDLEPYTCKICDKKFKIRKQFTIHIKLQHKSIGFVEFDENYHVFFNESKSEKPFQPYSLIVPEKIRKPKTSKNLVTVKDNFTDSDLQHKNDNTDTDYNEDGNISDESLTDIEKDKEKSTTGREKSEANKDKCSDDIECVIQVEPLDTSNLTEKDYDVTETDVESHAVKKRKRKMKTSKPLKKLKPDLELDLSSDDSDVPLLAVKNKSKLAFLKGDKFKELLKSRRRRKDKFVCMKCNKNCYTYQNYHHHLTLHERAKSKQCIKCNETFKSKTALSAHIESAHSSSRLTQTLKQLLERRKNNNTLPTDQKSIADGIRRTIKKVVYEKCKDTTTLTPVNNKLSVKNFFENFTPDTGETGSKETNENKVSIKLLETIDKPRSPTIKMTKFYPHHYNGSTRPKMPVKFKDTPCEKYKVSLKLVSLSRATAPQPLLRLSHKIDHEDHTYDADGSNHQFEDEPEFADDREDDIPEVAEEVMLNTEPAERETFILPNIPKEYANMRIAHLQETAPYYKIVKVDDVMKQSKKEEPVVTKQPSKIVLPDGTKLVTVNPLAHLMGDTNVDELFKSQKKYYESKPKDIKLAIAKALDVNRFSKKKKKGEKNTDNMEDTLVT